MQPHASSFLAFAGSGRGEGSCMKTSPESPKRTPLWNYATPTATEGIVVLHSLTVVHVDLLGNLLTQNLRGPWMELDYASGLRFKVRVSALL